LTGNAGAGGGGASAAAGKIVTHQQLLARRAEARAKGLKLVQCHGCFDIVHPGHLRHLRHARAQGDLLLVTITGDGMIAKGTGRPLIPQELRAENLAALDCVDLVYIEPRPTAAELLGEVQPDVYVKGREYERNNDPRFKDERDIVMRSGGRVVFSSGDVVFSSTALIAALEQSVDPYHARLRSLLDASELSGEALARAVSGFRGKRVLVLGEVIQDTYVLCDRPDVAGESPIMTLRPVERRTYDGGAAIICRHMAAMGALPVLVTALDDSDESRLLRQRLLAEGVEVRSVHADRRTPEKQRFLVGQQKVMKLDLVERLEPDAAKIDLLAGLVADTLTEGGAFGADAAVIADFGLGLISHGLLDRIAPTVRAKAGVVAGDVSGRRSHLPSMRHFDLLCPSESELRDAYRQYDESLSSVAYRMMIDTSARGAIVTLGPEGLVAFGRGPAFDDPRAQWSGQLKAEHVPALSPTAIDALGCGDALIAAATLALAGNASLLAASFLGAVAAGVQVQRLGNTVVSATDLRHGVARLHSAHLAFAPAEVVQSRSPARAPSVPPAAAHLATRAQTVINPASGALGGVA
jgi:rfaE bifunctional protein kinase chain/domain/rfaE bifunctional protein nucleotidyltransferase chain/domain